MINKPKEEEGTIQKSSPRIVTKIAAREIWKVQPSHTSTHILGIIWRDQFWGPWWCSRGS